MRKVLLQPPWRTIFRGRPRGDASTRARPQMSDFNRGYARTIPVDRADMSVDAGLRSFMLGVYNKMALGLLLSAVLAWVTADFAPVQQLLYVVSPEGRLVGFTPLGTIIRFVPLAVLLGAMFMRN